MRCYFFFIIAVILFSKHSYAVDVPIYETVITEHGASDTLAEDAYLPSVESKLVRGFGKGSISRDLETSVGMPSRSSGSKPGALTSFSGLGRSSEEVGFQTLGVPLNPPQGGGFDLSSFPQYLWSKQRYQQGGVSGAYDPRASSATVTLTPWSLDAMNQDAPGVELFTNNSSANLMQTAVGAHAQREAFKAGIMLGNSIGAVEGPSSCFSLGIGSLKAHLIATDQKAKVVGSKTNPTPKAEQRTLRGVPVLEYSFSLNSQLKLQTSAFYDVGFIRLEDAENEYNHTRDHFNQMGAIFVLSGLDTKLGGGYRKVEYSGLTFSAPSQSIYHLSLSHTLRFENLSVEPQIKSVGDQSVGALLEGGVSAKQRFSDSPWAVFSRVSYSNQLPSLANRYYKTDSSFYKFSPNPDLKSEKMVSPVLGAEYKTAKLKTSLEGIAQFRRDTQIVESSNEAFKTVDHPSNAGDGRLYSVIERAQFEFTNDFSIIENLTYSVSRLSQTNQPFSYQRRWMGSFVSQYRFLDLIFRGASDAFVSDSVRVPAYGLVDLGVHGSWFSNSIEASIHIENITNRIVEFVYDYPDSGRIVSLNVTGRF